MKRKGLARNCIVLLAAVYMAFTPGCAHKDVSGGTQRTGGDAAYLRDSDAGAVSKSTQTEGYVSGFFDLEDIALNMGVQSSGDALYYVTRSEDEETGEVSQGLCRFSLADGSRTTIPFTFLEPDRRQTVSRFAVLDDGGIFAVVYVYEEEAGLEGSYDSVRFLSRFDSEGRQLSGVDMTGELEEDSDGNIKGMAVDSLGRLYIAGSSIVWLYDEEGDYQASVHVGSSDGCRIGGIGRSRSGGVYVSYSYGGSSDGYYLAEVDYDDRRLSASYSGFPSGTVAPGINEDFMVQDGDAVYDYNPSGRKGGLLLEWGDNDIIGSGVAYYGPVGEDGIFAVTRGISGMRMGLSLLNLADDGSHIVQEGEIVVAVLNPSVILDEAAASFNMKSGKYHVSIREYDNIIRLNADIASGNCPDIIKLDDMDWEQIAGSGIFEDLNAYLDRSEAFDRSDFFDSALQACTYGDTLAAIPLYFTLAAEVADAAELSRVFGEDFEPGWTVEEVIAYADAHPDAQLMPIIIRQGVMTYLMEYGYSAYIDWETGKCSFDSDSFKNVLKFVKLSNGVATRYDGDDAERLSNGEVLLTGVLIHDFYSLQPYVEMFNGEGVCIGYPTADGSMCCTLVPRGAYAIASRSAEKEGAWEFIESMLALDSKSMGFTTNKARLESQIDSIGKPQYVLNEDGSLFISARTGEPVINEQHFDPVYYGNWAFTPHTPTREEIDTILALIEAAVVRSSESEMILGIINEEAESFYDGQKTVDEAADIIQSRIQIYVSEKIK